MKAKSTYRMMRPFDRVTPEIDGLGLSGYTHSFFSDALLLNKTEKLTHNIGLKLITGRPLFTVFHCAPNCNRQVVERPILKFD